MRFGFVKRVKADGKRCRFPLFSRGVDTYRFEYGVFLLNKDIELLMSERDLRALDMRHTLPNLKNLLLTLTSGEAAMP